MLKDVAGWCPGVDCSVTMLSAVTGRAPLEVAAVLHLQIGIPVPTQIEHLRSDYNILSWLPALNSLGIIHSLTTNYRTRQYSERPTIDEWMKGSDSTACRIIFCDNGEKLGHVFSTEGDFIVDTWTAGRRIQFKELPPAYRTFRVKYAFDLSFSEGL